MCIADHAELGEWYQEVWKGDVEYYKSSYGKNFVVLDFSATQLHKRR